MTRQKHLKQLVRDRMKSTGERYAAARRWTLRAAPPQSTSHRPGSVPAVTALRVLLTHLGINDPLSGEPLTEAMLFGLAGGVGIGVFSFFYEKEDFASFFVAGRHLWHDDTLYLRRACERLGVTAVVKEASSPKAAEKQLRELLAAHGPCIAWVDMAGLPHRGLTVPAGGLYHVISINSVDDAAGTAIIGDLTDEPITISMSDLTAARGRIRKDKYRLLAAGGAQAAADLNLLVNDALQACHAGLTGADAPKNARRNFSLDALGTWAERLTHAKDPERWERVFAPGHRMWAGLTSIHRFVEYYGTGGGLCRPLLAEFFADAAVRLKRSELRSLSVQYDELGRMWADLADAALPDEVAPFAEYKSLSAHFGELFNSGGSPEEKREVWRQLEELGERARQRFPLTAAACVELRSRLAERVRAIHAAESAAHRQLSDVTA